MASSTTPASIQLRCKGILFDMDGILISSMESVERCWRRYAALRGVDAEYVMSITQGCRAIDTVKRLRPDLDPEEELNVIEGFELADCDGLTVLPGVPELLVSLPDSRWAVVTSATEKLARKRLEAAGLPLPRYFVTGDRVTNGKPHPEPFLSGAARLGFAPGDCVVFEDAPSGVRAGRDADCTVVATTYSHSAEELGEADYRIADVTGVRVEQENEGLVLHLSAS
jgi:sugar-phosphatase